MCPSLTALPLQIHCPTPVPFFHNFQPSASLVFLFPELCLYFIRNLLRVHLLSLLLFDLCPLLLSHALLKSPKMAGGNVVEIKS